MCLATIIGALALSMAVAARASARWALRAEREEWASTNESMAPRAATGEVR